MGMMSLPSVLSDIYYYWGYIALIIGLVLFDVLLGTWMTKLIEYVTKAIKRLPVRQR